MVSTPQTLEELGYGQTAANNGSDSSSGTNNNNDEQASGMATDKRKQIEALIAAGHYKEAAELDGAPLDLRNFAAMLRVESEGIVNPDTPSMKQGESGAPTTDQPDQQAQPDVSVNVALPGREPEAPSGAIDVDTALNNSTKLFEFALLNGPAPAMEVKAAIKDNLKGIFSPTNAIVTSAEPGAMKEKINEVTSAATNKINEAVDNSLGHVVNKAGTVASTLSPEIAAMVKAIGSNLIDPLRTDNPLTAMVDYGTGKFGQTGSLQTKNTGADMPESGVGMSASYT